LGTALSAGKLLYGAKFNPELTLKSLSYFGDGTLPSLPEEIRARLSKAVLAVDLTHLPPVVRKST
jgi:hypothetical protein